MKRLLIGGLAVGSLLFAASGVASANTSTPLAAPAVVNLDALTTTSSVTGGSWPLSGDGRVTVSFATPASTERVSGYAVSCKAPTKSADGLVPLTIPSIAATFEVDPSTGASTDADLSVAGTTTSLKVGPFSVVDATQLPPLTCTVVVTNAGGASKAGKPNKATAPAPTGDCSVDAASVGTGLESVLGGGSLAPLVGPNGTTGASNNKAPVGPTLPVTVTGKQTATNFDVTLANLTGFGGPAAVPFCTTNNNYEPHLLSDQSVSFGPTLTAIPAVTTPASRAHPAEVKFTALGLTASVKTTSTLTVSPGSQVLYAYDAVHFNVDSCPSSATLTCFTNTAAIVAGGAPAPPAGVGYIAVIQTAGQTVLPGHPLLGVPATMTFSKNVFTAIGAGACDRLVGPASATCVPTTAVAGPYPTALGIAFGGAQTTIAVGAAPGVPVQVAPPGSVILQLSGGVTDGGDLNYKSAIAAAPSALF